MAIIVPSCGLNRPLQVPAVQNVLMPLVGFHDGCPSGDDESDKTVSMTMFSILPQ